MATPSIRVARHHLLSLVACLGLASPCLDATEKHWIAHRAHVIVVGTFKPGPVFPWFDGWHMSGVVDVEEVLHGARLPRQIRLRRVLAWSYIGNSWPPPRHTNVTLKKGIWFLRRFDESSWELSISPDQGFAPLSERSYWVDYLRRVREYQSSQNPISAPATAIRPSK